MLSGRDSIMFGEFQHQKLQSSYQLETKHFRIIPNLGIPKIFNGDVAGNLYVLKKRGW